MNVFQPIVKKKLCTKNKEGFFTGHPIYIYICLTYHSILQLFEILSLSQEADHRQEAWDL